MAKFFNKPFAANGTVTTIPSEVQTDGMMSFLEGWGYDYERHPLNDPLAKHLERSKMNYLFYIITEAIGELQRQGASTWDEERIPYASGATVWFANKTWVSLIATNNDKPGITTAWKDISVGGGGGGGDLEDYYTKTETEQRFTAVYDEIKKISMHEPGDIYPISRITVVEHEYICNGDVVPILSNVGIAASNLPEEFKEAWGIKKIGTQLIKLPMIIDRTDNNVPQEAVWDPVGLKWDYANTFTVPMFSLSAGIDREKIEYYGADTKPIVAQGPQAKIQGVKHVLARFTPVIWLPIAEEDESTVEFAAYFEGPDNVGPAVNGETTIRQLRFGLYQYGERYGNPDLAITGLLNMLFLYNKSGAQIAVTAAGTAMSNTENGATMIVTLNKTVSAATMTAIGRISIPDGAGEGVPLNLSFTLIKELLV